MGILQHIVQILFFSFSPSNGCNRQLKNSLFKFKVHRLCTKFQLIFLARALSASNSIGNRINARISTNILFQIPLGPWVGITTLRDKTPTAKLGDGNSRQKFPLLLGLIPSFRCLLIGKTRILLRTDVIFSDSGIFMGLVNILRRCSRLSAIALLNILGCRTKILLLLRLQAGLAGHLRCLQFSGVRVFIDGFLVELFFVLGLLWKWLGSISQRLQGLQNLS